MSWVGSSRAKYDALRSRKTSIDLRGARNSSRRKSASRCIFFVPPTPPNGLSNLIRTLCAGWSPVFCDDEEEEAAVEDDVEDHVGVAALVSHRPSLCPGLTSVATSDTMAAKERASARVGHERRVLLSPTSPVASPEARCTPAGTPCVPEDGGRFRRRSGRVRRGVRTMRIRLLALAACLAAGLFLTSATASGPASGPNAVTAWNANAGEAVIAACFLGGFAPQEARMYAMMHVAIHDALNGIDRRSRPYAASLRAAPGTSPEAAVAAAARDVLVPVLGSFSFFLPAECISAGSRQRGSGLRGRSRRRSRTGPAKTRGVALGQAAAAAILALRSADGFDTPPIDPTTRRAPRRASTATRRAPPSRSPRTGARSPPSC